MKRNHRAIALVLSACLALLLAGCGSSSSGSASASASGSASNSVPAKEPSYYLMKDVQVITYRDGETKKTTTTYEYDSSFNKTGKMVNGRLVESWSYDDDGNVVEHVTNSSSYERTVYTFEDGVCVREDVYNSSSASQPVKYTTNEYDDQGNLVCATTFLQNGNRRVVVEYTYDGDRPVTETHNGKLVYEYVYNSDGSYAKRVYYVDKNDGSYYEMLYDENGAFLVDGNGWTYERERDSDGKVIRETATAPTGQVRAREYKRAADGSHVTETVSDYMSSSDSEPYQTVVTETDLVNGKKVYSRSVQTSTNGMLNDVEEHFYTYTDEEGNMLGEEESATSGSASEGAANAATSASGGNGAAPATDAANGRQGSSNETDKLSNTAYSGTRKDFNVSYILQFCPGHICYLVQLEGEKATGVSKGTYAFDNGKLAISGISAIKEASYSESGTISLIMVTGSWVFRPGDGLSDTSTLDKLADSLGPVN